jgi:general secretion pathway protein B
MSSILKALKKLEQEKAARKPDSFRIDAEILRGGAQRSRFFSSGASLAAVALFLCGVGATYLYMKHDQTSAPVQQSQSSKSGVGGDSSTDATLFPVSTLPAAVQPQPRKPAKGISMPEKSEPSSRSMVTQQHTQRVKSVEIVPQAVPAEPKSVSPLVPVAPLVPPAKSVLKVNGIAFQDGADSVAVINGVTVSNGSVIEGARVEEIQKDRVRFSRGGEKFEIILDKSN